MLPPILIFNGFIVVYCPINVIPDVVKLCKNKTLFFVGVWLTRTALPDIKARIRFFFYSAKPGLYALGLHNNIVFNHSAISYLN